MIREANKICFVLRFKAEEVWCIGKMQMEVVALKKTVFCEPMKSGFYLVCTYSFILEQQ